MIKERVQRARNERAKVKNAHKQFALGALRESGQKVHGVKKKVCTSPSTQLKRAELLANGARTAGLARRDPTRRYRT